MAKLIKESLDENSTESINIVAALNELFDTKMTYPRITDAQKKKLQMLRANQGFMDLLESHVYEIIEFEIDNIDDLIEILIDEDSTLEDYSGSNHRQPNIEYDVLESDEIKKLKKKLDTM